MIVKYQALRAHLQKKRDLLYVLVGQDPYVINDVSLSIKKAWRQQGETDEKTLFLHSANDWSLLRTEASSYSLFFEQVLLDVRFDKKSIDAVGKECFLQYLKNGNPRCLIIFQASQISMKQISWLTNHADVTVIPTTALPNTSLMPWIKAQLTQRAIPVTEEVPALIHQYTQGNMLACAQVFERLALISDTKRPFTTDQVKEHLIDQCEFQLYELAEACLSTNTEKALHLIRLATQNRTEPTLILWLLTQEIRLLIELSHLRKQSIAFATACNQLKIWPQKMRLYESSLKRLSLPKLYLLLEHSQRLDERIKTNQTQLIWHDFDHLILGISK